MSRQSASRKSTIEPTAGERDSWPLSPCVLVCTLDDNDQCLGCGRSLEQISGWALMSKAEQWSVVDALAEWDPDDDDSSCRPKTDPKDD